MISMPVIDKNSGIQNLLSAKNAKGFQSDAEEFGQIMQQSAVSEQKTPEPVKSENETDVKEVESVSDTKTNAMREKIENNAAEEEATEAVSETEQTEEIPAEDMEQMEEAASYVMSELAQLLHVTPEALQEAMEDLGMTKAELLTPQGVKELVIQMTEGADGMSLLTDADLYQTVNEALEILDGVVQQLAEEMNLTPEEFQSVLDKLMNQETEATVSVEQRQTQEEEILPIMAETVEAPEEETTDIQTETTEETNTSEKTVVEHKVEPEKHTDRGQSEPQQQFMTFQNQQQPIHNVGHMSAVENTPVFSTQTIEIMDQIMDFMKVEMQPEITQLQMQLHPESLGTLSIQISSREGIMTAQFTTANEDVKAVLESQMIELKQNLEQQGIKVEAVEVTIAEYSLGREAGGEQSSENNQYEQQKKGRRSLRISDLELDELTEEEKVEVEVMKAEGSTVSYMA